MLSKFKLNQLYFKDTQFANLMTRRIFNVLLIANPYDAFMLEDDGRIDEKIFNEYTSLSLRYPPRFTQVSTCEEALTQLSSISFDLIICMPGTGDNDSFDVARYIKNLYEQIPMVILTPFSHGITKRIANEDLSPFEYVFCWLGNTDLLVSIIKLIEDKMNLEHDVNEVGVQLILLVEDGIRFYSSILPNLYKFVLKQSQEFSTEALNAHQRTLRMRGRPKIVLARTYEEAFGIYQKYKNNILGVITDVRFPRVERGEKDGLAGIKLCAAIRKEDPFVPLIIQSSESDNVAYAAKYDAAFIDKNSKKMDVDLRRIVSDNFGFGDFIFRNPDTLEEIARVKNLKELQNILFAVPAESFLYHISRNHVSRWLYSRAMFPVAEFLRPITWNSLQDVDAHRKIIFEAIVKYRKMKNQGVVAVFKRDRFDRYSNFARIGDGSLGGKGRGLAFIDNLVKHHPEFEEFENARVAIPKTIVLCTDVFDEFMDTNNLYQIALSDADDDVILRYFLKAKLPDRLVEDFFTFFDVVKSPLAIRSSSLLEDSHYQPFAGIYSTYMIPYVDNEDQMLRLLLKAVKSVYASVYFAASRAYIQSSQNLISEEKMAVIIQEVCGTEQDGLYFPTCSGVARSINYYPIGDERPEDGVCNIAMGLGKLVVDGGRTLRFSPRYPQKVLQTSTPELALRDTQNEVLALSLRPEEFRTSIDDAVNLRRLGLTQIGGFRNSKFVCSVWDRENERISDSPFDQGRKVITFNNILKYNTFPLAEIISDILTMGAEEMRCPVEVEFAVNMDVAPGQRQVFNLLQIRPIIDNQDNRSIDWNEVDASRALIYGEQALGIGQMTDIADIIYVKSEAFDSLSTEKIAEELLTLNNRMRDQGRPYILVGPGRWGSSDPFLGVPVKWNHISEARVIVECGIEKFDVEPSQGTHFFQNVTSLGVGYLTINPFRGDGLFREKELDARQALYDGTYLRQVRFDSPLWVCIDGRSNKGMVREGKND